MSEHIVHVTDDTFAKEVLNADMPVLVDFWAEWCVPCKTIAPILDEVATEYSGKLKVVKLDVDQNKDSAGKYQVRGIPTLILFKEGELEANKVGVVTKSQLVAFIESSLHA
jgi:thioredoxin 1